MSVLIAIENMKDGTRISKNLKFSRHSHVRAREERLKIFCMLFC